MVMFVWVHWLWVEERIDYKVLSPAYNCFSSTAPQEKTRWSCHILMVWSQFVMNVFTRLATFYELNNQATQTIPKTQVLKILCEDKE